MVVAQCCVVEQDGECRVWMFKVKDPCEWLKMWHVEGQWCIHNASMTLYHIDLQGWKHHKHSDDI